MWGLVLVCGGGGGLGRLRCTEGPRSWGVGLCGVRLGGSGGCRIIDAGQQEKM